MLKPTPSHHICPSRIINIIENNCILNFVQVDVDNYIKNIFVHSLFKGLHYISYNIFCIILQTYHLETIAYVSIAAKIIVHALTF